MTYFASFGFYKIAVLVKFYRNLEMNNFPYLLDTTWLNFYAFF